MNIFRRAMIFGTLMLLASMPVLGMEGGAQVFNFGEGQQGGFCNIDGVSTDQVTAVVTPSGKGLLSCRFDRDSEQPAEVFEGFNCRLNIGNGDNFTNDSHYVRAPGGKGILTCRFTDAQ